MSKQNEWYREQACRFGQMAKLGISPTGGDFCDDDVTYQFARLATHFAGLVQDETEYQHDLARGRAKDRYEF